MNYSFEEVIKSHINNSKSKQTHCFPKAKRFSYSPKSICNKDFYDLTQTMMCSRIIKKISILSKSERFIPTKSISPSPGQYNLDRQFEKKKKQQKGIKFGKYKKESELNKSSIIVPGPGAYSPKEGLGGQAYTMRSKIVQKSNHLTIGPAQYNIQKYEGLNRSTEHISKYSKSKQYKIGREKRFNNSNNRSISPGPGHYHEKVENLDKSFTFSKDEKKTKIVIDTSSPGPGAYHQFSEFAAKKNRLVQNLNKIQQIAKSLKQQHK